MDGKSILEWKDSQGTVKGTNQVAEKFSNIYWSRADFQVLENVT